MSELASFRSIIELWPTRDALASELGHLPNSVSKWWQRDRIPDVWWSEIVALPKAVEAGVTADLLAKLAARELLEARA